jgi:hypothetical protein
MRYLWLLQKGIEYMWLQQLLGYDTGDANGKLEIGIEDIQLN